MVSSRWKSLAALVLASAGLGGFAAFAEEQAAETGQPIEVRAHLFHRIAETLYLARDKFFRDLVVINFQRRTGDKMRMADGDAARYTETVQRETHGASIGKHQHWRASQAINA